MKTPLFFFILQTVSLWLQTDGFDLGSLIPLCSAKDPNLNDCVKTSGQKLIPLIKNGIPEISLPPLDPISTPSVDFKGEAPGMDVSIKYKNIQQTGFSGVVIENAEVDLAKGSFTFWLTYPVFGFTGDYKAKGQLFDFQVEGDGKANITLWNCTSSFGVRYHVADDRIFQDSFEITYTIDKIFLDYTNLIINGDEELSASASTFINENSAEIIDAFRPQLIKFYRDMNGQFIKTFLEAIPYSALFKDV